MEEKWEIDTHAWQWVKTKAARLCGASQQIRHNRPALCFSDNNVVGKKKNHQNVRPLLSNLRFGKMSPPARLYTSIQEFNIIFCTAHCIATNKPHSNTMRTCHFDFSPLRSTPPQRQHTLYSLFLAGACRSMTRYVRSTTASVRRMTLESKDTSKRERERAEGKGGVSTPSLPDGVTWKRSSRAEGIRAQMEGA